MCKNFFLFSKAIAATLNFMQSVIFNFIVFFQPFNATRINAAAIEDRVKVLQKENKNVSGKAGFYEEFEVGMAKYRFLMELFFWILIITSHSFMFVDCF